MGKGPRVTSVGIGERKCVEKNETTEQSVPRQPLCTRDNFFDDSCMQKLTIQYEMELKMNANVGEVRHRTIR